MPRMPCVPCMPRMPAIPRRLRMFALRFERIAIIVSMVAQTAAIAMAGFMNRMCDIPSPDVLQAPFRAFGLAGRSPAGTTVLQINQRFSRRRHRQTATGRGPPAEAKTTFGATRHPLATLAHRSRLNIQSIA